MGDVNLEIKLTNLDERVIKIEESGGGDTPITVDSELSDTSTNPVQNKVITKELSKKGTYSKPTGGIPKTDFSSEVKASLDNADNVTALATEVDGLSSTIANNQDWLKSKNIWNCEWEIGTYSESGKASSTNICRSSQFIKVEPNKTYTITVNSKDGDSVNSLACHFYDSNFAFISRPTNWRKEVVKTSTQKITQFNTPLNCAYIGVYCSIESLFMNNLSNEISTQLEEGTEATPYSAYCKSNVELTNEKANNDIISDAWIDSTTYEVGQYCIYNNSLWKCLIQHNGQTPSEGTYWTKASITSELIALWNAINV